MRQLMLLVVFFGFIAGASAHEQACGPYAMWKHRLTTKFGEHVFAAGVTSEKVMTQLWVNAQTGTWSLLNVHVTGTVACLVDIGDGFELREEKPGAEH